jgi:putative YhdH/YhfP family quinone oxidoreductase
MLATALFAKAGFTVHALSGKPEHAELLCRLGAAQVLPREAAFSAKPMESTRFGGAVDSVGGKTLSGLLAQTAAYGNVASCGLVASAELEATVMPFIIRGVSLLGIASAGTERAIREQVWRLLAKHFHPRDFDELPVQEYSMSDLPSLFGNMLKGRSFGRSIVKIHSNAC